ARAMPKATEQHCDHQIPCHKRVRSAAPPKRDKEIIAQPRRKTDVPVTPKIARVGDEKWKFEVVGERDAEHAGGPARHVGVTRKIAMYLRHKAESAEHNVDESRVGV